MTDQPVDLAALRGSHTDSCALIGSYGECDCELPALLTELAQLREEVAIWRAADDARKAEADPPAEAER